MSDELAQLYYLILFIESRHLGFIKIDEVKRPYKKAKPIK